MKIVIAGAGEVGVHLAKMLSKEQHDIVLIDEKEERLAFAQSADLEILPMVGNPTSLEDLKEAGIKQAHLFISVTPEECVNITACMLAANLGAGKTFARINNYEYLLPENKSLFDKIGLNDMIYPEMLAAREIVSAIKRPWTRQYWELFGGAISLLGIKVRDNAPIINKELSQLSDEEQKAFHIVAIKRNNDIIIPRGSDQVKAGDLIFVTTTHEQEEEVRRITGKEDPEIKKVYIMGGSRIARRTAQYLPDNIRIKIFETNKEKSVVLSEKLKNNVMIINGDARDTELLMEEGIQQAQAFVALTENASTNILACMAAKRFGVYKTVAQVENLDYIPLAEKMDIGSVINKKLISASHIYQFLLDTDVTNVKSLAFANANVAELVAHPRSRITRKPIKSLNLPRDMTLGGLMRDGRPMMIDGDTTIQANDQVVVFCLDSAMHKLKEYFN